MRFLAVPAVAALVLAATPAPTPALAAAPPGKPRVPAGTAAGYVVFDRQTGKIVAHRSAHRKFRSASVVKLLIAIDYLESHPTVPARDQKLLKVMLRVSDDDAASAFWNRGGQGKIIKRTARRLGLTDTAPPPADKPGFWGYTSLSALDVVRTYRYLLDRADPRVGRLVLGHLRRAGQCGSDGFDQFFGIPRGVPGPWAVKQGWSGYGSTPPVRCTRASPTGTATTAAGGAETASAAGTARTTPAVPTVETASAPADRSPGFTTAGFTLAPSAPVAGAAAPVPDLGRPVLHTTGLVGPRERWIMVLLTAHPAGTGWQRSTRRTTALAGELYRSVAS
ncbi:hypothetical protein [Planobispora takensis]|uniref:Lipoprotein n=1 Tax=Planobispora takensis TaxID=1367882 RepID=A0A8J3WWJ9_9ACTN|nr:hypothetical protein [Planobispora takensis]GII03863.1 lipoprotein [Planobispora takensis]